MQRSTKCRQDSSEGSEYFVAFRSKEADHIALPKFFDFVYFCQAGNLCSWRYWMITDSLVGDHMFMLTTVVLIVIMFLSFELHRSYLLNSEKGFKHTGLLETESLDKLSANQEMTEFRFLKINFLNNPGTSI